MNALDNKGMTPLHYAARENENLAIFTMLIELGADVTIRDKNGFTAHSLVERDNSSIQKQEILQILLDVK